MGEGHHLQNKSWVFSGPVTGGHDLHRSIAFVLLSPLLPSLAAAFSIYEALIYIDGYFFSVRQDRKATGGWSVYGFPAPRPEKALVMSFSREDVSVLEKALGIFHNDCSVPPPCQNYQRIFLGSSS